MISSNKASRRFSLSFLESLTPSMGSSGFRMTAATQTGPHRGPRPASSTPQMLPCSARFAASNVYNAGLLLVLIGIIALPVCHLCALRRRSSEIRPHLLARNSPTSILAARSVSTSPPEISIPRLAPMACKGHMAAEPKPAHPACSAPSGAADRWPARRTANHRQAPRYPGYHL